VQPSNELHYSKLIDQSSREDLQLALLRAIDHAKKSSSEIAEYKARLESALHLIRHLEGQILNLQSENDSRGDIYK